MAPSADSHGASVAPSWPRVLGPRQPCGPSDSTSGARPRRRTPEQPHMPRPVTNATFSARVNSGRSRSTSACSCAFELAAASPATRGSCAGLLLDYCANVDTPNLCSELVPDCSPVVLQPRCNPCPELAPDCSSGAPRSRRNLCPDLVSADRLRLQSSGASLKTKPVPRAAP